MREIWKRFLLHIRNWMRNRYGADQLGMVTLTAGLMFSLLGSLFAFWPSSVLGLGFYILTVLRMFSRNVTTRQMENRRFLQWFWKRSQKARQFIKRWKNRKIYKYFRCPGCGQLLRLTRGCGEKTITCAKCGHQFKQKA